MFAALSLCSSLFVFAALAETKITTSRGNNQAIPATTVKNLSQDLSVTPLNLAMAEYLYQNCHLVICGNGSILYDLYE